jgi:hypothetical protein
MEQQQLFTPGDNLPERQDNHSNGNFLYIKEEIYKPTPNALGSYDFKFPSPSWLELKKSIIEDIGIGVFTTKDINEGDIIERIRTIELTNRARYQHDDTIINYMLTDYCSCRECIIHGPRVKIMTGFGCFYNHQNDSSQNCQWIISTPYNFLDIVATKDIKAGQELFLDYGPDYFKKREYKNLSKQ